MQTTLERPTEQQKERGYEHRAITHKDSKRSHSIITNEQEETQVMNTQQTRRSNRNKNRIDYKTMHTGQDIILTEGQTEVSKHAASEQHEKNDITIKALSYDQNWYTRGIREAIEIKRWKPRLNADEGRYRLNPIYDVIIKSRDEEEEQRGTPLPTQEHS